MQIPAPLPENGTIAVISPSSTPKSEKLERGIQYLQKRGYTVKRGEHVLAKHKYLAGRGPEQLADLHSAFADENVDAIICTRGGYGTPRYLHELDFELIRSNPKPFVGYSDITALQCAFQTHADLMAFSGPMVAVEMGGEEAIDPYTEEVFWKLISNPLREQVLENPPELPWQVHSPGVGEGLLTGGCLALYNNLMGTRFFPDFRGRVLVLEDVGEDVQHLDRMFTQFKQAGLFAPGGITGLLLGQFIDAWNEDDEDEFTLEELIRDIIGKVNFPIVSQVAYGHGPRKMTMPLGAPVRLDADKGRLILL